MCLRRCCVLASKFKCEPRGSRQGLEAIYERGFTVETVHHAETEREIRLESPTALRRIVEGECRAAQNLKKIVSNDY